MVAALTYTRLFRFFIVSLLSFHCFVYFSFPVTHSSSLLHFHPNGFRDCFQTYASLYFSSLFCLSSYCTCNLLRTSVSKFRCILLCSFSSVSSFFIIPQFSSLVSSDIAFQFHLLLLSTCSCFFSRFSSFSSVYFNLFAPIAFIASDQILLLEKLLIVL